MIGKVMDTIFVASSRNHFGCSNSEIPVLSLALMRINLYMSLSAQMKGVG